jgi:two-component system OmpR family sensor kinase
VSSEQDPKAVGPEPAPEQISPGGPVPEPQNSTPADSDHLAGSASGGPGSPAKGGDSAGWAAKWRRELPDWARPSHWNLRTKMVLATLSLLTAICFIVGLVCYLTISITLNAQLNASLTDASARVTATYKFGTSIDKIPGIRPGTMFAVVQDGALRGNLQYLTNQPEQTGSFTLSTRDQNALLTITPSKDAVDRKFDFGEFRVIARTMPDGNLVITGLPTGDLHETQAALLLTIVLVSASGLIAMGLVGAVIIRRAMAPLDKLAAVATRVSQLPLDEGEVKLAERVPPSAANNFTEIGTVGLALNRMLDNVAFALQSRQRSETKVRQFVADASHELRTPLTAIRGYTEMLKMTEDLSPSGEKSLSRVESQSKRMGAMVEDLLTLARLDEGKPLELKDTEMTQLVVETVNDMKVAITDHNWRLDLPSDPFIIKADAGAIRQVLLNLLSNAAKHTDAGTTVTTSLKLVEGDLLRLTVADNGPGIPEEFQAAIFDRFSRVDAARSGHDGTTGLGLSIVQAIVQAHGGRISLRSVPGKTEFMVDLPRKR